jgi:hypothetical protein
MTHLQLTDARASLTDRVAAYFRALPNCWINARELTTVGGFAAWRTRVSELRKPPYAMTIENRTRREGGYTISEYRWVKE